MVKYTTNHYRPTPTKSQNAIAMKGFECIDRHLGGIECNDLHTARFILPTRRVLWCYF